MAHLPLALVLATFFFVFPAIAVQEGTCEVCLPPCEDRACYKRRFEKQKALTAEANNKCGDGGGDDLQAKYDALKADYDALKAEDWKAKYDALSVKHAELQREFDDQHWWVWTCCTGLKTTTECQ